MGARGQGGPGPDRSRSRRARPRPGRRRTGVVPVRQPRGTPGHQAQARVRQGRAAASGLADHLLLRRQRNIAARAPHGRRWKALSTRSPMPAGTGDHQTGRVADLGAPAGTTSWCTCWCCWTRSTPTGTCPSRGSSTTPGGSQSTSCPDIRTTGRMVTVPSGADFRPRGGGGVRPGRLRIRRVIRAPPSYPAPHRRPHLPARGTRLPRCAGTPDRSAALAAVRAGVHRPLRAARVAGTDRGARGWHHGR